MCFDYEIEKIERENKVMIATNEESTRIAPPQSENTKKTTHKTSTSNW
jgi:hypothetical protein